MEEERGGPVGPSRDLEVIRVEAGMPTANMHDAIAAVELALAEAEQLTGRPLRDLAQVDDQGNVQPVVTIVTDNGGPFRSFTFEAPVTTHPELRHVRTRIRTPGQNGSRERGLGSLTYERGVPRRDPRRPGPGRARRALPHRGQHRPTPPGHRLEPPHRGPPRLRRPHHPQPSRTPEPAISSTRDNLEEMRVVVETLE